MNAPPKGGSGTRGLFTNEMCYLLRPMRDSSADALTIQSFKEKGMFKFL